MVRLTLLSLVLLTTARIAMADAAGDELQEKVLQAYRSVNDYRSTVSFQVVEKSGRWTNTQSADIFVALDRDSTRLSFDKPDMRLLIDQGKLLLNSPEIEGRHLEVEAPAFDLEAITQVTPFISRPMTPDVAFLTARDPIAALGGVGEGGVTALPAEETRPGLQFNTEGGTMVLRINPTTHLIETAVQTLDVEEMGGEMEDSLTITFKIDAKAGEAAGDDAFKMDTEGSTAVTTVEDLIGSGGMGDDEEEVTLEGQEAPQIELKTLDGQAFTLSEVKAKVVVLDFWATWCPPCREGLPKLQSVYDWAAAEKKDVAIYTVNLQELPQQVRDFWTKGKFTMPVIMDADGETAEAYGVQSIPQTFVISGGKVAHVHVGYDPAMADTLKAQIEALLAQ